jgi:hypothetical protein
MAGSGWLESIKMKLFVVCIRNPKVKLKMYCCNCLLAINDITSAIPCNHSCREDCPTKSMYIHKSCKCSHGFTYLQICASENEALNMHYNEDDAKVCEMHIKLMKADVLDDEKTASLPSINTVSTVSTTTTTKSGVSCSEINSCESMFKDEEEFSFSK